jgi:hypothetical protein
MSEVPAQPAPDHPPKKPRPLHRLAKPQPKPQPKPALPEPGVGSGSATGFVSMLAHRQFEAPASLEAAARRSRDQLRMAREVQPKPPQPPAPPKITVPRWYPAAAFGAITLAALLTVIGAWAIGALAYMHRATPILAARDVHYPLITWSLDIGTMGGYTPASRMMAWSMLACLPIAVLLLIMATLLRRQIAAARQSILTPSSPK